ncbi:MAG TPA: hypothetical protein VK864_10280 [Longimicrobiales bacterium]|nr:hypothetical protein [Longimicrobiales bacterium]
MSSGEAPSVGRLLAGLTFYFVLAVPLFAYLWSSLNELFAGEIHPLRLGIAAIVLPLFVSVLFLLVRAIERWESQREATVTHQPGESR